MILLKTLEPKNILKSAVLALGLCFLANAQAMSSESNEKWAELYTADQIRADFEQLLRGLQSGHPNLYVHRSEKDYLGLYESMLSEFDETMSLFDIQIAFQRFAAYGNVAHAKIDFPEEVYEQFRENGGRVFPLYIRIVEGRAFVAESYSGNSEVFIGDEIIAIEGKPTDYWLRLTAQHISADTDYIAHSLLEFWFSKYLWLEMGEKAVFNIELKTGSNEPRALSINAKTRSEIQILAEQQEQSFALDSNAREGRMLTNEIAYLRPGPFYNVENPAQIWNASAFKEFVDQQFSEFMAQDAQALIIDLRANPGGDNSFSDHLLAWFADEPFRFSSKFWIKSSDEAAAANQKRIDSRGGVSEISNLFAEQYAATPRGEVFEFDIPLAYPKAGERFEGKVYILINRHSYSNAVTVAAMVQDYGFGVIAGEKTSDMATTYGAMETFTLEQTGIVVSFPKAHIIRPSGDTKSDGVTPDIIIPSPVVPQQNDVVLERLLEKIGISQ